MKREHRQASKLGLELRATTVDDRPGVTLHAIRPGVVDDYGSLWQADAFDESLARRLPTLVWAHDWSEPLGPATDFRTSQEGPEVDFVFSDFDAVPLARRAHAQVADGTIQDCSVGFSNTQRRSPTAEEQKMFPGVREVIEKADLDEISLVMRGAVPGAKVLAVRAAGGTVAVDDVVELAKRMSAGELTLAEAQAALTLLADEPDEELEEAEEELVVPDEEQVEAEDPLELEDTFEAALAVVERSA